MFVVCCESDIADEALAFSPQFTHQVFGERETIVGYKNLKIKVCFSKCVLCVCLRVCVFMCVHLRVFACV